MTGVRLSVPQVRRYQCHSVSARRRCARKIRRCCRGAAAMPTICRCRPARCTPTSSARRIRTPISSASIRPRRWRMDGVWAVITGEDVRKLSDPFLVALKSPVHQWSLAVERVRYVGEPVALVVAESRYLAEDAAELVADRVCAARGGDRSARGAASTSAPLLHAEAKTNEISVRKFTLRRHQDARSQQADQHRQADGRLPPALVHADGVLRRASPSTIRPTTATTCWRISRGRSARIR